MVMGVSGHALCARPRGCLHGACGFLLRRLLRQPSCLRLLAGRLRFLLRRSELP